MTRVEGTRPSVGTVTLAGMSVRPSPVGNLSQFRAHLAACLCWGTTTPSLHRTARAGCCMGPAEESFPCADAPVG
eukprot:scaffold217997_cov31-Tisochrysis_lutea.AAC.4